MLFADTAPFLRSENSAQKALKIDRNSFFKHPLKIVFEVDVAFLDSHVFADLRSIACREGKA